MTNHTLLHVIELLSQAFRTYNLSPPTITLTKMEDYWQLCDICHFPRQSGGIPLGDIVIKAPSTITIHVGKEL